MAEQFEVRIGEEGKDISFPPGIEIIDAEDVVSRLQQAITKMGTDEAGSAGD